MGLGIMLRIGDVHKSVILKMRRFTTNCQMGDIAVVYLLTDPNLGQLSFKIV